MKVLGLTPLLNVEDVARSLRFYCDVLGFQVVATAEPGGRIVWARVAAGDAGLMLNEHGGSRHRESQPSFGDIVLYLSVDDADTAHANLKAGGYVAGDVFDADYGLREFHLRDPDGYEISITSPLTAA